MDYVVVEEVVPVQGAGKRSPVVFIHGAPDSPLIWEDYVTESERKQDWLKNRGIVMIATPNSRTNPVGPPKVRELMKGVIYDEIADALLRLMQKSPTRKIVLVCHDFGATYAWHFIRHNKELANKGVEKMISFSVGSSFRYDVLEHGVGAFIWIYSMIFCLPYYLPFAPIQWLVWQCWKLAGFLDAPTAPNEFDAWQYWYGPMALVRLPFDLLMLTYEKEFVEFTFPVFFMRSPQDRIASTKKFEQELQKRDDCRIEVVKYDEMHWFVQHHAYEILPKIRDFMTKQDKTD